MPNFVDEGLLEAHHRESLEAIAPVVAELMEARSAVAEQLAVLEARIAEFKETRERLKSEIASLRSKGTDMAVAGGDPLKLSRQIREREAQIEDIGGWLADLEARVMEKEAEGSEAQAAVLFAYKAAEAVYHQKVQEEFDNLHECLSKLHTNYASALRKTFLAVVQPDQFSRFKMPHPGGRPENWVAPLHLKRSKTIYDVQTHGGVPNLGRGALR